MLSEISQSWKDTVWFLLYKIPKEVKFIDTGPGEEDREMLNGNRISGGKDELFLEVDGGDGHTSM